MRDACLIVAAACLGCGGSNPTQDGGWPDSGNPGGDGGACVDTNMAHDSPATAIRVTPGTSLDDCLGPGNLSAQSDLHFFEVNTPAGSAAGGYFQISQTHLRASEATLWVSILSSDAGVILPQYSDPGDGGSLNSYFAAAAQGTYFLEVLATTPYSATQNTYVNTPYTLSLTYAPVNDPYKPDGLQSEAKPLALDAGTSGSYVWAGYVSSARPNVNGTDPSGNGFDDWFSVSLASGTAHLSLTNVPSNFEMQVDVLDPLGTKVQSNGLVGFGSPVSLSWTASSAGTYNVHLYPQGSIMPFPAGLGTTLPPSFTQPYALTVTQP